VVCPEGWIDRCVQLGDRARLGLLCARRPPLVAAALTRFVGVSDCTDCATYVAPAHRIRYAERIKNTERGPQIRSSLDQRRLVDARSHELGGTRRATVHGWRCGDGPGRSDGSLLRRYHVGSVILTGRSSLGVEATAQITAALQSGARSATSVGFPLLIATDQEGGMVQVLGGPGFSSIPAALQQGTEPVGSLRALAQAWGFELHAAGVNVNLAPVMDVVPNSAAASIAPIGAFDRQFGQDPANVAQHGLAFMSGMEFAGVSPTAKHFPGLGRVNGNPDNSSAVTDGVTSRHDTYLEPFAAAIKAGAPLVMVSTATYRLLDPNYPAAFSRTIVTGILRGDMNFRGVIAPWWDRRGSSTWPTASCARNRP